MLYLGLFVGYILSVALGFYLAITNHWKILENDLTFACQSIVGVGVALFLVYLNHIGYFSSSNKKQ